MADIARARTRPDRLYSTHQCLVGDLDQSLGAALHLAHCIHAARITMPAVDYQRNVDVYDLAITQRLVVGNSMADDMIDGRADGSRIAAIVERCGNGIVGQREIHDHLVELRSVNAGPEMRSYQVQRFGAKPARGSHGGECRRPMQFDLPGVGNRSNCGVDICHEGVLPVMSGSARSITISVSSNVQQ
jgi:hypothetical protein